MSEPAKQKIRIRMEQPYESFSEARKAEFLREFSHVTGVPVEEFENTIFRKGCVIFEVEIDSEAVTRFLEGYGRAKALDDHPEINKIKEFIKSNAIKEITDDFKISVAVHTRSKTAQRKLLFVHGWGGDKESFGKMPEMLSDLVGCESEVYEYPTGIWKESPSIEFISRNLDNWIRNLDSPSRLAAICHSMGGLVTRNFLVLQSWRDQPIDVLFKQITFIASPHNGVPLAKLGQYVPAIKKSQITELQPNSPFLVTLNNQWAHWVKKHVPHKCVVRSIYGTNDDVVAPSLAIGDDPEAIPMLNAGHIDIIKPKDEHSEIVQTIKRLLLESDFSTRRSQGAPPERT